MRTTFTGEKFYYPLPDGSKQPPLKDHAVRRGSSQYRVSNDKYLGGGIAWASNQGVITSGSKNMDLTYRLSPKLDCERFDSQVLEVPDRLLMSVARLLLW